MIEHKRCSGQHGFWYLLYTLAPWCATQGGADKFLDLQELIYAFIRGPDSGRQLYYRYGKKSFVVVRELGYPSTKQLARWVRIYEEKGDLPRDLKPRERYSRAQKIAAVEHYLTHAGCLSYTRRAIGYPSNEILKRWIEELYPNARPLVIRSDTNKCFSPEERSQDVRELCNRRGTARKVAQNIGVSVPVLYKWKKDLISDEAYQSMHKRKAAPQDKNQDALLGEIQRLRQQVHQL